MNKIKVIGVLCIAASTCLTGCWFESDSDKDKKNAKASVKKQVQVTSNARQNEQIPVVENVSAKEGATFGSLKKNGFINL